MNRSSQSLTDFVRALKAWIGVEPGSSLIVAGPDVVRIEHRPACPPDIDLLGRLMTAMNILTAEDVDVLVMMREGEGDE